MTDVRLTPGGNDQVAEIQGLYGAFSFPEKLLQKLWLRREFDERALATADGRRIEILNTGRWNLLGGPDFKAARLRIDGVVTEGDVELHLRAEDWGAHRHAQDPAYDGVVLHVVLFPPAMRWTSGGGGRMIPVLALLPWLHHDLESYAADDAVEGLANRPLDRALERLGRMEPAALSAMLVESAARRWALRRRQANVRVARLGWREACHHTALEILGYRFNRTAMLRVAAAYPLATWAADPQGQAERAWVDGRAGAGWVTHGVRPANHPRTRLRQYACWVEQRADWPEVLRAELTPLAAALEGKALEPTKVVRREADFGATRLGLIEALGGRFGGTRLDNLVCDGMIPLCAVEASSAWETVWRQWWPGDVPDGVSRLLRTLQIYGTGRQPACHGLVQGLLGWLLEHENGAGG